MYVAIYCGSSMGTEKIYEEKAKDVAKAFAQNNMNIVYGGSESGLMGVVSSEGMKLGIDVIGVITKNLAKKEIAKNDITELHTLANIRERKAKMSEIADAFIAMPGGYGTFEEIFEMLTEHQIGYHKKPCAFYNVNGYYDKLIEFLDVSVKNGFIERRHKEMLIVSDDIEEIITSIKNYQPPKAKWE